MEKQIYTSDDKVVSPFDSLSIDFTTTNVFSGSQLQFEVGDSQWKVIKAHTEVLPVGVTLIHPGVARVDTLRLMASIIHLEIQIVNG